MVISSSAILKSNLFTQPHANLFNLINNKNNIPDPISTLPTQQQSRKMVYTREPDLGHNFKGYPLIAVYPAEADYGFKTLGMSKSFIAWTIKVEIWSSDRINEFEGRGMEFIDNLSDYLVMALNNLSNRKILLDYGMANITPNVVSTDILENENELVYVRRFDVNFNRLTLTG